MPYLSSTDDDRREMLRKIGVRDFDDILSEIPENLRLNRSLNIPALSEMELLGEIKALSDANHQELTCFAGGGVYDHFIPSAVDAIISRPEFLTAYTPYQAEVSQGTLQVIYEFQSHICRLTGMDVANASMYDGASASAEALAIAGSVTKRRKVVIAESVNPLYRQVAKAYLSAREIELVTVPIDNGITDLARLKETLDENAACVLIAQPNFFGMMEDINSIAEMIHAVGGHLVMSIDPVAQVLLKTPADCGADIVVGEGQPLGIPLSYGGPLLGFFAARKELIRSLPGRIAARTKDIDGRTGFVLTLQTREQHIRRDKATSNICTNQALCALAAAVYMSLMGRHGLKQVALLSAENAQRAASGIFALDDFEPYFPGPFVREFAIRTPRPAHEIVSALTGKGILPGVDAGQWYPGLKDCLLIALTEKRTAGEIDNLVGNLKEFVSTGVLS